jgi:hypothetical protein
VVAIAATGSTSSGSSDTRRPGDAFLDTIFTFLLLAIVVAGVLFVYALLQRDAIAREVASGRYPRRSLGFFLLFFTAVAAASYLGIVHRHWRPLGEDGEGQLGKRARSDALESSDVDQYHAHFAWIPVLVVLALAGVAVLAWFLAARRRAARERSEEGIAETLTEVIDDTLDDLRAESDPRRAVIACYARLERVLAAFGLPRRPAETQEEYLRRILGKLEIDTGLIRRSTELFTQAEFSHHQVDVGMKDEAIATLEQVRDELHEAAERRRREAEEAGVLREARA